jgi:hypothetical protein
MPIGVDGRSCMTNAEVMTELMDRWGRVMLPIHVGVDTSLFRAQMAGQDCYAYDPASWGAERYLGLAECAMDRGRRLRAGTGARLLRESTVLARCGKGAGRRWF